MIQLINDRAGIYTQEVKLLILHLYCLIASNGFSLKTVESVTCSSGSVSGENPCSYEAQ